MGQHRVEEGLVLNGSAFFFAVSHALDIYVLLGGLVRNRLTLILVLFGGVDIS